MAARGYCKIPEVSFYSLSLVGIRVETDILMKRLMSSQIAHHGVFCSRAWRVRDNGVSVILELSAVSMLTKL